MVEKKSQGEQRRHNGEMEVAVQRPRLHGVLRDRHCSNNGKVARLHRTRPIKAHGALVGLTPQSALSFIITRLTPKH